MKSKTWMWLILAVLPTLALAQTSSSYVSGLVDVEFQSQYMFRGFRVYGGQSAMQVTGDVEVAESGFGGMIQSHFANGSGRVDHERWDYNPYYRNAVFVDQPYMLEYRVNYLWYNFPKRPSNVSDMQELNLAIALPNALSVEGLAPTYQVVKMWQAKGGSQTTVGNANSWMHIFGLTYNADLPGMTPESPSQSLKLLAELTYNDGVNPIPGGGNVDNDWSHFVLGAATDFDLGYHLSVTPSIYYQRRLESDLNSKENEFWVTLSGRWVF